MDIFRWWESDPTERYWLEVTDRNDLGSDLNAPKRQEDGREYYGYSLIREIADGDIILHYHKDHKAIVAISQASGNIRSDGVIWGAHGVTARSTGIHPYAREGWRRSLRHFHWLSQRVTLDDIRARQEDIEAIRTDLERHHSGHLYFPFEVPLSRPARPTQAYLTKLPAALVRLFPELWTAAQDYAHGLVSESEYLEMAQDPTLDLDSPLDSVRLGKVRLEQHFLRMHLFGEMDVAPCGLCGREFPLDLLVAAHVKPRSRCTDSERRDYRNLVMAMCKFGCDDLFEHGYLSVNENGSVVSRNDEHLPAAVQEYLRQVAGRRCKHWSLSSEPYFAWHREHHGY